MRERDGGERGGREGGGERERERERGRKKAQSMCLAEWRVNPLLSCIMSMATVLYLWQMVTTQ